MYNYFNGQITIINPKYIVCDVNNIGYEVYVANPYAYTIDERLKLYIYQNVKEDELTLYGFKTLAEKELFLDLISVKGIGPKTALVILAATTIADFKAAVKAKDLTYLMKFPKIGKKSAQQITIDLETKYANLIIETSKINDTTNDEVLEALQALGYDKKIIINTLKRVEASLSIEEKIKESLKLLIKI
ncbi:MAG: Holliday junction branch migration protein RuvA [Mycoplasmatales bacterium]